MNENSDMIALTNRSIRLAAREKNLITACARESVEESEMFQGCSISIRVEGKEDRFVLEGSLPSSYSKQMLEVILRAVDGVEQIENRIVVDEPPAR